MMMKRDIEKLKEFEIKKKKYSTPALKKYGTFSEMTKGNGFQGQDADGQTYFGYTLFS